jgi:hypothetical protein
MVMRDCVVAWSSDQVPERHLAMYAGGKDASLSGEHTPRCVCGNVIGHGPFHPAPSRAASRPKFALQAFRTGCVEFNGSENQEGANKLNVRKPVARLVS